MGIIAVITNPNAKRNRKERERADNLRRILGDRGEVVETPVPEDLTPVVERLVKYDIDVLCVCGGDGTMQHTLTAFINAYGGELPPLVLPLRGGTMNTIRRSVGLNGSAEDNLAATVRKYDNGEPFAITTRDIMCANGKYCFLFGNGLVANFLDVYYGSPYDGPTAALYVITGGIGSLLFRGKMYHRLYDPLNCRVFLDDQELPVRQFMGVLACTVLDLGMGFKPMYRAEEKDGTMHVLASGLKPGKLVRNLGKMYKGRLIKDENHIDRLASQIYIEGEKVHKWQADGEVYEAKDLKVTMGPLVRIITGC